MERITLNFRFIVLYNKSNIFKDVCVFEPSTLKRHRLCLASILENELLSSFCSLENILYNRESYYRF